MRIPLFVLSLVLVALCMLAGAAHAQSTVKVVDTWPQGERVVLASNQNFYLRLAYSTDKPSRIWATPYFEGRLANAGSSPSSQFSGSGETFAWFFLMKPDVAVDEVRITAGDGSLAHTPMVADYRVHVSAGGARYDARNDPAWVVAMRAQAEQTQRRDYLARMNEPVKPGGSFLVTGFMLAMCAVGSLAFALPAWALWSWHGGWRIAAAAPAALMVFVVLRLVLDTSRDPTSHNLWPFEILMFGGVSVAVMLVLQVARRLTQTTPPVG